MAYRTVVLHTDTDDIEWAIAALGRAVATNAFADLKSDAPERIEKFRKELELSYRNGSHLHE